MYIFIAGALFTFFCFYLILRYLGWVQRDMYCNV
jgi:hypothetical protein